MAAAPSNRRGLATSLAGVAVLVTLVVAGVVLATAPGPEERNSTVTLTESVEEVEGGPSPGVTTTTTEERATAATDTSALGRLLSAPGAQILLTVALVLLSAFLIGAFVQRVVLGEYAVTVGPLAIPALPPVEAGEAAAALLRVAESPALKGLLSRAPGRVNPQDHVEFHLVQEPRLQFLSIRTELEARIREVGIAHGIDRDVEVRRTLTRLRQQQVIDDAAEAGLKELLALGDRVAAGAAIADEVVESVAGDAFHVLYALGELARRGG